MRKHGRVFDKSSGANWGFVAQIARSKQGIGQRKENISRIKTDRVQGNHDTGGRFTLHRGGHGGRCNRQILRRH